MGKKKANGEGSITKRKDGRYMGRYTVESKRKAVYGDSFEEVRQKLNEILNEIAKGAYVEPNKYSVEKMAARMVRVICPANGEAVNIHLL